MADHGSTDGKPRASLVQRTGTGPRLALGVGERDGTSGRRFVGRSRDVGELELAQEQVRRLKAELARVLRVATVERLAAGLAHKRYFAVPTAMPIAHLCADYGPCRLATALNVDRGVPSNPFVDMHPPARLARRGRGKYRCHGHRAR